MNQEACGLPTHLHGMGCQIMMFSDIALGRVQDKFDSLITQLEMRNCILGFSPDDKQKSRPPQTKLRIAIPHAPRS